MTTSYQNQCMTGEAIYNNFQNGQGGEGLSNAADKVNETKLEYDLLATDIRQLTVDMEAIWEGPSAGAAHRGAGPLAVEHELAQPELHNVHDLTTRQVESYNSAKNSVQPIPNVPEEPGLWDNITSFGGASDDYEQSVAANRAANDNNVQVMQTYDTASTYNGENMPTQYGQMQPDNSKIEVGGGTDKPGENGGDDRNGTDEVTRPPGSNGERTGVSNPTGTPTNPSGYTPTTPGGYQPGPGGTGHPPGTPTPYPTPYPPPTGGPYPPGGPFPPGGPYPPGTPPGGRPPGSGPGGRPPGFPGGRPPGTPPGTPPGGPRGGGGPGGYGPGGSGPGSGGPGGMRGGAGSGFGPGGPGAGMGAEDGRAGSGRGGFGPGGMGAGGAAGAGGGGRGGGGGGMMGGGGAGGARGGEDEEHTRASFLVEDDPDALFGTDQVTAPPVIGE